jgi:hypothetical protein
MNSSSLPKYSREELMQMFFQRKEDEFERFSQEIVSNYNQAVPSDRASTAPSLSSQQNRQVRQSTDANNGRKIGGMAIIQNSNFDYT